MTPKARELLVDAVVAKGGDRGLLQVYSNFRVMLELFHRYGADFNHRNKKGVSPVLTLLRDRDIANLGFLDDLISYGADVNLSEDNNSNTPLLEAIYAYDNDVSCYRLAKFANQILVDRKTHLVRS